jgi:carbon-monoxide dehydrogenase medium subunit
VKAAPFDYRRPATLDEAVGLLAQAGFEGKALAGGQSLLPMLNLRLAQPALLVDLSGLAELRRVEARDGGVFVGAGVTHAELEDGIVPGRLGLLMAGVAAGIAYRAVRTRGTVGGSLAHADPAGDWPSALLALGAEVEIAGAEGHRRLPLGEFQQGAFTTALRSDEVLVGMRLPEPSAAARWGYWKFCRKPGEFAEAIGAVLIDGPVRRRVVGAAHGAPVLVDENSAEAVAAAAPGLDDYELQLHAVALRRAEARARA